jgi:hypothetical protein
VLRGLRDKTIRQIIEATGLSLRHCARIRRGEIVQEGWYSLPSTLGRIPLYRSLRCERLPKSLSTTNPAASSVRKYDAGGTHGR